MSELTVRSKIWLEVDGQPFLGDGRYRLLRRRRLWTFPMNSGSPREVSHAQL